MQREIRGISPEEEEASSGGSLQNAKQSTQEDEAEALCQQEVETPVATSQEVETPVATSQEVETPVATSQVGEMPAASASTQEDHGAELPAEIAVDSDSNSSPRHHDDSGFQSPTNEALEEEDEEHEKAESRSAGELVKASVLDPEEVLLEIGQPHTTDVSPRDTVQNGEYATDILL